MSTPAATAQAMLDQGRLEALEAFVRKIGWTWEPTAQRGDPGFIPKATLQHEARMLVRTP